MAGIRRATGQPVRQTRAAVLAVRTFVSRDRGWDRLRDHRNPDPDTRVDFRRRTKYMLVRARANLLYMGNLRALLAVAIAILR